MNMKPFKNVSNPFGRFIHKSNKVDKRYQRTFTREEHKMQQALQILDQRKTKDLQTKTSQEKNKWKIQENEILYEGREE